MAKMFLQASLMRVSMISPLSPRKRSLNECKHLLSISLWVAMTRELNRRLFNSCIALQFLRLFKPLEDIGWGTFFRSEYLEVVFLPSTVKMIEEDVFHRCLSLRLLFLPNGIDLSNVGYGMIGSNDSAV